MRESQAPSIKQSRRGGALCALSAHLIALPLALLLWRFVPLLVAPPYPLWAFAVAEGILAALIAIPLRCAPWWWGINALFAPLLLLGLGMDYAPGWMALLFLALLLLFWNVLRERVPLYLSNATTHAALRAILEREGGEGRRVIDLGSGFGGALRAMAEAPRVAEVVGVESAPLPWLVSALRFRSHPRIRVHWASLWSQRLSGFDVVYAFLSPEPMPRLWAKLVREARRPMLLISNGFPVPEVEPDEVIELDDVRRTELFLYRLPRP